MMPLLLLSPRFLTLSQVKKPAPAGYGAGLIALTGGPCGGKSSSMNYLKEAMLKLGLIPPFS
eukprot:1113711-Rhodomonas_salina.1